MDWKLGVSGPPPSIYRSLKGDIVFPWKWTDNLATYKEDLSEGKFKELGINFEIMPGLYVPRYVIEGDAGAVSNDGT